MRYNSIDDLPEQHREEAQRQMTPSDKPNGKAGGSDAVQSPTEARRQLERAQRESLSRLFLAHWERNELPTLTPEYQFHPKRRWRFDFCLPEHKIAIEIHGGTWQSGRHNRAQGFAKDREKMNAAQALGWVVIELTDAMLREGREAVDRYLQPVKEILAAGGTRLPDGGLLGSRRSAAGD